MAANAVYAWAAERIGERRGVEEVIDSAEQAVAVRMQMQTLGYRAHEKLMRAFLEPEDP